MKIHEKINDIGIKAEHVPGFPRKFNFADDVSYPSWGELKPIIVGNLLHSQLIGVSADQHHFQIHAATHNRTGSDPLELPFEIKDSSGNLVLRIDTSGNLAIKGRYLKI